MEPTTSNGDPDPCRVLLIDLENCPQQLGDLSQQLRRYSRIIAFYGVVEPKLTLSLARELAAAMHDGRLQFVGMQRAGKNAADFGLAFWAGRLMVEMPADAEFVVLSRDTGLDHVVDLLKAEGRTARRAGPPAVAQPSVTDAADEFFAARLQDNKNRPAKRRTLLSSIRSFHKDNGPVDGEQVLAVLMQRGIVSFDEHEATIYAKCDNAAASVSANGDQ